MYKKIIAILMGCIIVLQGITSFAYDFSKGWEDNDELTPSKYFVEMNKKHHEFASQYDYHEGDIERSFNEYPDVLYTSGIEYREDGTEYECPAIYVDFHAQIVDDYDLKKSNVKFIINGEENEYLHQCVIYNDRTLVPVDAFKEVGCTVEYNNNTVVATLSDGETVLEIMPYLIGMRKNQENGYYVPLETCARFVNGTLFVPARAVANEFNIEISWDEQTRTVELKN